jgi:hypothetical protein
VSSCSDLCATTSMLHTSIDANVLNHLARPILSYFVSSRVSNIAFDFCQCTFIPQPPAVHLLFSQPCQVEYESHVDYDPNDLSSFHGRFEHHRVSHGLITKMLSVWKRKRIVGIRMKIIELMSGPPTYIMKTGNQGVFVRVDATKDIISDSQTTLSFPSRLPVDVTPPQLKRMSSLRSCQSDSLDPKSKRPCPSASSVDQVCMSVGLR